MKSEIRLFYVFQYIFIILIVCGLVGGMLFDLGSKFPIWLYLIFCLILIGFPLFTILSYLLIPIISVDHEKVVSKSFVKTIEIPFDVIVSISFHNFKNKLYSIGYFYVIKSSKVVIEIPKKIYKNETMLMDRISKEYEKHQLSKAH